MKKHFAKIIFALFSGLFLIYLILPGPSSIKDFPDLPNSLKSTRPGDTYQNPENSAYFSYNYRDFVTSFYKDQYQKLFKFPFPAERLNYPPEDAFTLIADQTKSTFLEEYVYPFRGSLFVNGFEPFYQNGQPKYYGATDFFEGGKYYPNKTTLRFYSAPLWTRLLDWLGVCLALVLLWQLGRKIFRHA